MTDHDKKPAGRPDWRLALIDLPRAPKRILLALNDFALLSLALWLALSLRLSTFYVPDDAELAWLLFAAPLIGVATFFRLGLYRLVTRFISAQGTIRIFMAVGISVLLWSLLVLMTGLALHGVPRSVIVLYAALASFFIWASRQFAGFILKGIPNITFAKFDDDRVPVVIYGAGGTGVQLLESLKRARGYMPIGFLDENRSMWGQVVGGVKVFRPDKLASMIEMKGVKEVFLALPEASRRHRQEVIRSLTRYPVIVKTLPDFADIASGRVRISDLRPLDIGDLLGRDQVPPDKALLARAVTGRSVLVTGAGGTIGSELARQILRLAPSRLVLFEVSEPALYEIEYELQGTLARLGKSNGPQIVPVLGSVLDRSLVRRVLTDHAIQTIYHAAAYKHVPMVEANPVAGLSNNIFGTRTVAEAARDHDVERMVLISTDKAVRPTNVMGASKRLSELVLQSMADGGDCETVFTMVRFGNVLDSSGSVVRLFRRQIENGGPVTVTHPDVLRYFMSIPEAAELVLQAGAMAKGGEVFVLDMGEPVLIDTLARSMIRLMGREVLDDNNPDGDIRIEYVGLRPGEKLREELLIGANTTGTEHKRIARCREPFLDQDTLDKELRTLNMAMTAGDIDAIDVVLQRCVEGYVHNSLQPAAAPTHAIPRTLH